MSLIRIEDIAYVRFSAPDLAAMRAFLVEFGLTPVRETATTLYARGAGPAPFVHATILGEPGFAALGLRAESLGDLQALAAAEGAAVEDLDAPGGGKVVRLTDPDGRTVEVVAGQAAVDPLPLPPEPVRNTAADKARLRRSTRIARPRAGGPPRPCRARGRRLPHR